MVAHPHWNERGALDCYELEVWDRAGPVFDDDGRFVMEDWGPTTGCPVRRGVSSTR